jgi:hypothetical protein
MGSTRPLRAALLANALFSTTCAAGMLCAPDWVGNRLGLQLPLVWPMLGLGLLLFAVDLVHQATRPRLVTWRSLYASLADGLWVLGTGFGVAYFAKNLSNFGLLIVLGVAAIVLMLGVWQLWGIHQVHQVPGKTLYRHCLRVRVRAAPDAMWQVISQLGDIHNYTPALKHSEILDGKPPGLGVIRRCVNQAGKSWCEECVDFEPGCRLVVRFLAEAPDFPFPARMMRGGWDVSPAGHDSEVMVWWELQPQPSWLAPVLLPVLAFQADRAFPTVIEHMATAAREQESQGDRRSEVSTGAQLLPTRC